MEDKRYDLVVRRRLFYRGEPTLRLSELADLSGCHPELLERLARFGVFEPVATENRTPLFAISDVKRVRRALRLRDDLGLNANALGLVVDLLERIEDLEAELDRLRS